MLAASIPSIRVFEASLLVEKAGAGKRTHEDFKVHGFDVEQEWNGNFIVLGTTGSGKTTLIKCVLLVHSACICTCVSSFRVIT